MQLINICTEEKGLCVNRFCCYSSLGWPIRDKMDNFFLKGQVWIFLSLNAALRISCQLLLLSPPSTLALKHYLPQRDCNIRYGKRVVKSYSMQKCTQLFSRDLRETLAVIVNKWKWVIFILTDVMVSCLYFFFPGNTPTCSYQNLSLWHSLARKHCPEKHKRRISNSEIALNYPGPMC